MENTLTTTKEEAMELHQTILYNYRMAAHHLVDAAYGLKKMRDTKAYTSLGMVSFEEYTEKMAGIKARQAYTYITTLERLGPDMMTEQAALGITKLNLLSEITPAERVEFTEQHDLAGMTVKEIEALVEENNRRGEQLDMFAKEQEQMSMEMEAQQDAIRKLKAELETEQNKPPKVEQVTVSQPTEEQMEEIRRIVRMELQEENAKTVKALEAEQKEKLKKAKESAGDKVTKAEEAQRKAESAAKAAEERVQALQKQLDAERAQAQQMVKAEQMAADGDYRALDIYFAQLQDAANHLLQLIASIRETNPEKSAKTGEAMARYFEQMVPLCRGGEE